MRLQHHPSLPDVDDDFPKARAPLPLEQLEAHARRASGGAPRHRRGRSATRAAGQARSQRRAARRHLQEVFGRRLQPHTPRRRPKSGSATTTTSSARSCSKSGETFRGSTTRSCPTLTTGRWRRYPRVYVFARDFVMHTAGRFDQESLHQFADAYQDVTPLTIGELWAIPIMLRLALVENLCGLAVQTLRAKQEREDASKFAAKLLETPDKTARRSSSPPRHRPRSSWRSFTTCAISRSPRRPHGAGCRRRLNARGQSPDEVLRIEQQREAIDQLSIANIINTMRVLSALDWPTFVEGVSRVERILRRDPAGAYADMDPADPRSLPQVGGAVIEALGGRRARSGGDARLRSRKRRSASAPKPIARIMSATT